MDVPFHGQKPLVRLLHPHYPRWWGCQGVRGHSPGGESDRGAPVRTKRFYERRKSQRGPSGRRSLAQPGRDEGRRQGTLPRRPHLPGGAVLRHRRGLYTRVLGGTAADRGDPAHPAPA